MTNIKLTVFALASLLFSSGDTFANERDPVEVLSEEISSLLIADLHDNIVKELVNSGVSEMDAETALLGFADQTASCLLSMITRIIVRDGGDPSEVLANIDIDDVEDLFDDADEEEFEENVESCLNTALANAGVKGIF